MTETSLQQSQQVLQHDMPFAPRPIAIITDPRCLAHDTGGGEHPETAARLTFLLDSLASSRLAGLLSTIPPRPAERQWLTTFHSEAYLFRFEEAALSGRSDLDHRDNQLCFASYEAALLSAGAGLTAIDLMESGKAELVFCASRPPGHHAEANLALGFCFLNNVALAARYWQRHHHRPKIAIIDWDAHHGNGIQSAFEEDPEVLYISLHEHPTFSFPGSGYAEERGTGSGRGTTLNLPLPPGADDAVLLSTFDQKALPLLNTFAPEALIVAAGFDGHRDDDMSGLAYSTEAYAALGQRMAALANRFCRGRILSILEGGYHLSSLADSALAYLNALSEYQE